MKKIIIFVVVAIVAVGVGLGLRWYSSNKGINPDDVVPVVDKSLSFSGYWSHLTDLGRSCTVSVLGTDIVNNWIDTDYYPSENEFASFSHCYY